MVIGSDAFNGHSMTGKLLRALVCSPRAAGWDTPGQSSRWKELGFLHAPDFASAQSQHDELCRQLVSVEVDVVELHGAPDLSLDAVYAHDPSFMTDQGMIALHSGKINRVDEVKHHKKFLHSLGIPVWGEIKSPGCVEAGDVVWLDAKTVLAGSGYRTNPAGIFQLRALLGSAEIEVLTAPLPYGTGPTSCLHLMSLMSLLDEGTVLVDMAWLAVETVELLKARGYRFIEIDGSERDTLACNVLALGNRRLLALQENPGTNERLAAAGFEILTFPGSELCINGNGGPTCLTRPLLRS
jgi:N-dimethylarginine dimethylaminohydrolase